MTRPRLLVCIGDLHAGSTLGLMPHELETTERQIIQPNPFQRWLLACWQRALKFTEEISDGDPFALLVNGDLVDGIHHKSTQVISPKWEDHVLAAKHVLQPLTDRAANVFITRGTECHTLDVEDSIGRAVGATVDPDTKRPVFDRLHLEMAGVPIVARHHVPTSSRPWTESSALAGLYTAEVVCAVTNGERHPRIVIGAHRHKGTHLFTRDGLVLVTHPWQGLTRFAHKVVPHERTHPGVYILDWREREDGELPEVHFRTYEAPHQTTIRL